MTVVVPNTKWMQAIVVVFLSLCCEAVAQQAITITRVEGGRIDFTIEQLRQMPQQSVSLTNPHTGKSETYEGVLLVDLLARLKMPSGEKLRGAEMRDYVEVTGRDR